MSDMGPIGRKIARVAILVDGDSLKFGAVAELEKYVQGYGARVITRVYGDMTLRPDWAAQRTYLATHCPSGSGNKNRADMQLAVDAIDFAHRGLADTFVIASNDRDFDPVIGYLRANGCQAERLARPEARPVEAPKPVAKQKAEPAPVDPLVEQVRAFVKEGGSDGILMSRLGATHTRFGVKISETPERNWRTWLLARPKVFICDARGPFARVRLTT